MNVPGVKQDLLNPYDVTLLVKNGQKFKAHRQVLSEASPFFEKLLNSDMKENKEGIIRLETITECQMADILQFIYTGSVQKFTQENANNLIALADYLCLSNLKYVAGKFFERNMSVVTCLSSFYLAEQYQCGELIDSTRKFILSNFETIAETESFMNLPSHEVEKWISSDEIVVSSEENVFKIILGWIDRNKSERSMKFSNLFRHVRLTCLPRDFLISDVVTNDFVKENKNCVDSATAAVAWIDQTNESLVPRPHLPRKSLNCEACVIAACGEFQYSMNSTFLYVPEKEEYYLLPERNLEGREHLPAHVLTCRGKLFLVFQNIMHAQCYDPDFNRWFPAPWSKTVSDMDQELNVSGQFLNAILAVKNKIWFIAEKPRESLTCLSKYDLDTNLFVPSIHLLSKICTCCVAVDRYIYAIGGISAPSETHGIFSSADFFSPFSIFPRPTNCRGVTEEGVIVDSASFPIMLPECSIFDTESHKCQDIAELREARARAFGVGTNGKIFIAGGSGKNSKRLKTCEVYYVETDMWHSIASLTVPCLLGSMAFVDGTLYKLCNPYMFETHERCTVERYDHEKDEWKVMRHFPSQIRDRLEFSNQLRACTFNFFKGALELIEKAENRNFSYNNY